MVDAEGAARRVGDGEVEGDVGHRSVEHPPVVVHRAPVEHLEGELGVGGTEEPEPSPGVDAGRRHRAAVHAAATAAARGEPVDLGPEAAVAQTEETRVGSVAAFGDAGAPQARAVQRREDDAAAGHRVEVGDRCGRQPFAERFPGSAAAVVDATLQGADEERAEGALRLLVAAVEERADDVVGRHGGQGVGLGAGGQSLGGANPAGAAVVTAEDVARGLVRQAPQAVGVAIAVDHQLLQRRGQRAGGQRPALTAVVAAQHHAAPAVVAGGEPEDPRVEGIDGDVPETPVGGAGHRQDVPRRSPVRAGVQAVGLDHRAAGEELAARNRLVGDHVESPGAVRVDRQRGVDGSDADPLRPAGRRPRYRFEATGVEHEGPFRVGGVGDDAGGGPEAAGEVRPRPVDAAVRAADGLQRVEDRGVDGRGLGRRQGDGGGARGQQPGGRRPPGVATVGARLDPHQIPRHEPRLAGHRGRQVGHRVDEGVEELQRGAGVGRTVELPVVAADAATRVDHVDGVEGAGRVRVDRQPAPPGSWNLGPGVAAVVAHPQPGAGADVHRTRAVRVRRHVLEVGLFDQHLLPVCAAVGGAPGAEVGHHPGGVRVGGVDGDGEGTVDREIVVDGVPGGAAVVAAGEPQADGVGDVRIGRRQGQVGHRRHGGGDGFPGGAAVVAAVDRVEVGGEHPVALGVDGEGPDLAQLADRQHDGPAGATIVRAEDAAVAGRREDAPRPLRGAGDGAHRTALGSDQPPRGGVGRPAAGDGDEGEHEDGERDDGAAEAGCRCEGRRDEGRTGRTVRCHGTSGCDLDRGPAGARMPPAHTSLRFRRPPRWFGRPAERGLTPRRGPPAAGSAGGAGAPTGRRPARCRGRGGRRRWGSTARWR